jgi:hypothetical protein
MPKPCALGIVHRRFCGTNRAVQLTTRSRLAIAKHPALTFDEVNVHFGSVEKPGFKLLTTLAGHWCSRTEHTNYCGYRLPPDDPLLEERHLI